MFHVISFVIENKGVALEKFALIRRARTTFDDFATREKRKTPDARPRKRFHYIKKAGNFERFFEILPIPPKKSGRKSRRSCERRKIFYVRRALKIVRRSCRGRKTNRRQPPTLNGLESPISRLALRSQRQKNAERESSASRRASSTGNRQSAKAYLFAIDTPLTSAPITPTIP